MITPLFTKINHGSICASILQWQLSLSLLLNSTLLSIKVHCMIIQPFQISKVGAIPSSWRCFEQCSESLPRTLGTHMWSLCVPLYMKCTLGPKLLMVEDLSPTFQCVSDDSCFPLRSGVHPSHGCSCISTPIWKH